MRPEPWPRPVCRLPVRCALPVQRYRQAAQCGSHQGGPFGLDKSSHYKDQRNIIVSNLRNPGSFNLTLA